MDERTEYSGVLEDITLDTDYQLVAGSIDLPQARHSFWDKQIQYYQPDVSGVSCTIHSACGAVSDLTGYEFTLAERQKFWAIDLADPVHPANPSVGGYVSTAVDIVRKNFSIEPIVSFGFGLDSAEALSAFSKGYSVVVSFGGNALYSQDKSDGTLDETALTGAASYYHCLRICQDQNNADLLNAIVDNYWKPGDKTNIYRFQKSHLPAMVASGLFSKNAYCFAYKADIDHPPSLLSSWSVASCQKAKNHGIDVTLDPQSDCTSIWLEEVAFRLGAISSNTGKGLTKERALVFLDRFKNTPNLTF